MLIHKIKEQDWEFVNEETQYLTHNIHRYSGKFIPQIARQVIDLTTQKGDIILDPYLGSGTTALESMLSHRNFIGIDINPLAILIAKVKTTILSIKDLMDFKHDFNEMIDQLYDNDTPLLNQLLQTKIESPETSWRFSNEWNKKWYQEHVLKDLINIYNHIEYIQNENLKRIAQVAFSDILRKTSNASSKYPNVMYDKNHKIKQSPLKSFKASFNGIIDNLIELSTTYTSNTGCEIILSDNTKLSLADQSIDAIITHPPYIAAVPYAEYGCLSLEWFGHSSKELDSKLTGGRRHKKDIVERFESDYQKMISESARVLKNGKYAFFMVGNPTAHGNVVDLEEMTIRLGEVVGYKHLCSAKRVGINRRGNKMGHESLIFFQKL